MDECHGLLVTHLDGTVECVGGSNGVDECARLDGARHDWRASCDDVPGLCACAAEESADRRASRPAA